MSLPPPAPLPPAVGGWGINLKTMATQQFKDFAQRNNLRPHSFMKDIYYDQSAKYEIGEVERGVYFYGPVCDTNHFRKQVEGLEELVSRLYWFCGIQLNNHDQTNPPRVPMIQ